MKIVAIITNIILLMSLVPLCMGVMMTPMMFDAPGSDKNRNLWISAGLMVSLPITIIVCEILSWIAIFRGNYALALETIYLPPVIHVILIAISFVVMAMMEKKRKI
jgi:hypothetical protein